MNTVVAPAAMFGQVRSQLLAAAPDEAAAIFLAGYSRSGPSVRLLLREGHCVPPESYLEQGPARLAVSPAFLAPLLKRARLEDCSLVLSHTHPFSDDPTFSFVDDQGERSLVPVLQQRAPDRPHGALVIGREGICARCYPPGGTTPQEIDRIRIVGPNLTAYPSVKPTGLGDVRDDRGVRAFGRSGRERIRQMTVAIVGLGGTGSWVAEQLARLGVGALVLIDDDIVDSSNLTRLIGAAADDVGRSKVEVTAKAISRIREDIVIHPVRLSVLKVEAATALQGADFIFCCTDSQGSRALLNQFAYQYLIPTIDIGVRIDVIAGKTAAAGRVQMLAPGLPCLTCLDLLDPEEVRRDFLSEEDRQRDRYIVGEIVPQPAVVSLNGTMASLAVTMFLSAVTGLASPARYQMYRLPAGIVKPATASANPHCVICSLEGYYARGDTWPMPWRR